MWQPLRYCVMKSRKFKTIKHYHEPGDLHELTFSCYHQMKLLTNDEWRRYLAREIDKAGEQLRFNLVAFVFMPEHVHLARFSAGGTARHRRVLSRHQATCFFRVCSLTDHSVGVSQHHLMKVAVSEHWYSICTVEKVRPATATFSVGGSPAGPGGCWGDNDLAIHLVNKMNNRLERTMIVSDVLATS